MNQSDRETKNPPETQPSTKKYEDAIDEATRLSSEVLDIINLRGKVTKPGPGPLPCDDTEDDHYRIDHPWSVYGVPVADMEKSMERLKKDLPKHSWDIRSYGPDASKAKSLELTAEHKERGFSLIITLQDRRDRSKNPSLIEVNLQSPCYKRPDGPGA
ncbi:hypothetical protein ACFQVC_13070 [Streptomyces monticola]|uniref:Uncharacterized protein n=1 Tax=Streptomyces monticola TaxID=2666263 RepID=A0ABW2JGF9_9ACTN